jgi:hypothetical protein
MPLSPHASRLVWRWKTRKSNWHCLPLATLRWVVFGLASRERAFPPGPARSVLRARRLAAVALFRSRFGEDMRVERLSTLKVERKSSLPRALQRLRPVSRS